MNLPTFNPHEIGRAIDENFESQIDLLQRLVRAPSLRGQENSAQEIVAGALTERGYAVERFGIDMQAMADHPASSPATIDYAGAFNVVGRKEPRSNTGRSLALNAHIDVVPTADPSRWRYPPFSGTRDGGWLYGRGAGDMKAGLVANIFAFDAIEKAGYRLTAPVHRLEREIQGLDRPGEDTGEAEVEVHAPLSHQLAGGDRFGDALIRQADVPPAGEPVLQVPLRLAVAKKNEGRHRTFRPS